MSTPTLSFDLLRDVQEILQFPFMVNALEAATIVGVLAAVVGWYMVLRRQSFAGHTLSMMAFPGATGAALAGLPTALGYYLACGVAALAMSATGRSGRRRFATESAAIGTVQATGLALGFLFLSLNASVLGGMETFLFGNILAVTRGQVLVLLILALVALCLVATIARPLLFASIDPEVARARGVPVALLDVGFLLLLGLAVAATSQITGVLLVFTLLVAPPAAAQLITAQPVAGLLLSVAFALAVAWLGLGVAYFSIYPAGFFITMFAFGLYVAVRCARWALARHRGR